MNNDIYHGLANTWWAPDGVLHAMGRLLNPARLAHFRHVLTERFGADLSQVRLLDVGCGGGLLAEELATAGCSVVGFDLSAASVRAAHDHASVSDIDITYVVGDAARLPFARHAFDAVAAADVLEHVDELGATVSEAARVLAPGGPLLYETVNRTWLSRLIAIWLLQEFPPTRLLPAGLHEYRRLIRPVELRSVLRACGLLDGGTRGLWTSANLGRLVWTALRLKLGRLPYPEAARRLALRPSRFTALMYLGHAVKAADRGG